MSMDTIDDLEGAEDLAGALADALEALCAVVEDGAPAAEPMSRVERAMTTWRNYCRPSCDPNDDDECDDDECGCPCHSREANGTC